MMQAAFNGAEASAISGSAGIGRQAGLRCLCSTIDVRVQVPSPAPMINGHPGWGGRFVVLVDRDLNHVRTRQWRVHESVHTLANTFIASRLMLAKECIQVPLCDFRQ